MGGPVDYSTPIGTSAGLSFVLPPLAPGSDSTFGVRAFDASSGLEEANTDARLRIVTDTNGLDISGRPAPPVGLSVAAIAGGGIRVRWMASPSLPFAKPTGFHVYLGTPAPDYSHPAATVPAGGDRDSSATLPALTDGVTYQVAVRAFNAVGEETNTTTASITADATGPDNVDGLAAEVTFEG
jgi:hypothetical protein